MLSSIKINNKETNKNPQGKTSFLRKNEIFILAPPSLNTPSIAFQKGKQKTQYNYHSLGSVSTLTKTNYYYFSKNEFVF
jgi:hypothetical protein